MNKEWPVVEIIGDTIQGEGSDIGRPANFIRFAGCDTDCKWCDTKYATITNSVPMDVTDIMNALMMYKSNLVVLTGGNPCIHDLKELIVELKARSYRIHVETQGTKFAKWLWFVDHIVISPKGPSAETEFDMNKFSEFMFYSGPVSRTLKIVIFTIDDLEFAASLIGDYGKAVHEVVLQVGTKIEDSAEDILERLKSLIVSAKNTDLFTQTRIRILPQLHTLIWGQRRGV